MNFLKNISLYEKIIQKKCNSLEISGMSDIHLSHLLYSTSTNEKKLLITQDEFLSQKIFDDVTAMGAKALFFPARDLEFRDVLGESRNNEIKRVLCLSKIASHDFDVAIASIEAASLYTIPKKTLMENIIYIHKDKEYKISDLKNKISFLGYSLASKIESVGQYSSRGSILEIYIPDKEYPIRIDFFGDKIESIFLFDEITYRNKEALDSLAIIPVSEVLFLKDGIENIKKLYKRQKNKKCSDIILSELEKIENKEFLGSKDKFIPILYEKPSSLFSYFKSEDMLFVHEPTKVKESINSKLSEDNLDFIYYLEKAILPSELNKFCDDFEDLKGYYKKHKTIYIEKFLTNNHDVKPEILAKVECTKISPVGGFLKDLIEILNANKENTVVILAGKPSFAKALSKDLEKAGIKNRYAENLTDVFKNFVTVSTKSLSSGFSYKDKKFSLITYKKISNKSAKRYISKPKNSIELGDFNNLTTGDYVVHASYGLGIFLGIKSIQSDNIFRDYLMIKYAKDDILYVPVFQSDTIYKYVGTKDSQNVKLNKLGSDAFRNTKIKAKKATKEIAKQLMKIYSERLKAPGFSFQEDKTWQKDFEALFEYEETPDQIRCSEEIKEDMSKSSPMDRLLCGDVGFGKTEIAFRAAFKCITNGKQCAMLAPTTILAWQHYLTAKQRFKDFPVKIELLSRLKSLKEQKEIIKNLASFEIDMIIGTHRLIQKDVSFKDLGLLIVDEEQRFGVSQKEKFKKLFKNIDILSISATPIPRTLNMAMAKIRDISTINQAPSNRQEIKTYVLEYNPSIIAEAIKKEIRRGGQIYYVHNNVSTIERTKTKLARLIPEARFLVGHGKMSESELLNVWQKVVDHEIDVFICTTIIETGIDVPNVNTLIIENSDRFGLSQLYQLRGRIGRSSRGSYAYFTFNANKILTETAEKRLEAIKEFTKFGSGLSIAKKDLEIRGAGNILSREQHGHVANIGYDMYIKLLSDAVENKEDEDFSCNINIKLSDHIPKNYIENFDERLYLYKKISSIKNDEEAKNFASEVTERCGKPPMEFYNLIDISLIKSRANELKINEIKQVNNKIFIYFKEANQDFILSLLRQKLKVSIKEKPKACAIVEYHGTSCLEVLKSLLLKSQA